jgi:N-acetylglucosamine-6-phosphate deacetylase
MRVRVFFIYIEYTQLAFPKLGTTSFLASVIFPRDHPEKISAVLARLAQCVGSTGGGGAVLEGVHAEVRGRGGTGRGAHRG